MERQITASSDAWALAKNMFKIAYRLGEVRSETKDLPDTLRAASIHFLASDREIDEAAEAHLRGLLNSKR